MAIGNSMKRMFLLSHALSSLALIGLEALAITSWPLQKRRSPSLVPLSCRSMRACCPEAR